jgi:NitT/TauT family transport system permease protein
MNTRPEQRRSWPDRLPGKLLLGSLLPLLVLLLWWLGIRSGTAVVPTFGAVLEVLLHPFRTPPDLSSRSLAFSLLMTLLRLALGFSLGVATAVPLGFWAGRSRIVDRVLYPIVQVSRPVNPVVLLPVVTVLFGLSSVASVAVGPLDAWRHDVWDQVQLAMLFILWWGAFFPVFMSTVHGVRSVRTAYLDTMALLGATGSQVLRKVLLPHALPSIAQGMRIAMGVSWLVLLAAEIFPGTRSGIGYMLCTACKTSDYQYTFAAVIVIGLIGLLIDVLFQRLEQRAGRWQAAER